MKQIAQPVSLAGRLVNKDNPPGLMLLSLLLLLRESGLPFSDAIVWPVLLAA